MSLLALLLASLFLVCTAELPPGRIDTLQLQQRTSHLGLAQYGPARRPQLLQQAVSNLTLLSAAFLNEAPDNTSTTCDYFYQRTVLSELYNANGGPNWVRSDLWLNNTYPCQLPMLNGSIYNAPSYCCWFGVHCCVDETCGLLQQQTCNCNWPGVVTMLTLPRNNLTGPLTSNLLSWLSCELRYVDLAFNQLVGSINSSIDKVVNLQTLALGNNNFTGPLPGNLRRLKHLQVLDVTSNQLTGHVPAELCNNQYASNLADLLLANNLFNGSFEIRQCDSLVALDITANQLTGQLPTFEGYSMLHIARMRGNYFEGTMPPTINGAPLLTELDLSVNLLTGSIPRSLSQLRLLSSVRIQNNNLSGTLPADLFTNLGALMNLADNHLTGSIPRIALELGQLRVMDLSNNSLVGRIPNSFSVFAQPDVGMYLNLNLLSCCGVGPLNGSALLSINDTTDAYTTVNWTLASNPRNLLPSYLTFSDYLVPVPRNRAAQPTNMRCPDIIMANTSVSFRLLSWVLDPSYFLFHKCQCDPGYELVNATAPGKLPHFQCEQAHEPWHVHRPWALGLIAVGVTLVVLALLFLACYRKGATPAFVQQWINMRKRMQGEPMEGQVTVVTTDIEGYSELMKREPDLMGIGLRTHNFCIDKARWQSFGYTLEQEGDSFIIAFSDPFDAVAFCLQVQLLLQRVDWPEQLLNAEGGNERARKASMLKEALAVAARMLMRDPSRGEVPSSGSEDPPSGAVAFGLRSIRTGFGSLSRNNPSIPEEQPVSSPRPERDAESNSLLEGSLGMQSQPSNNSQGPPYNSPVTSNGVDTTGFRVFSTGTDRAQSQSQSQPQVAACLRGLRVRMGIATGRLHRDMSLRSSSIMERSKVVSDAAAGGQVLMDGPTYDHVKARLIELGAVDHNGLALEHLHLSRPTLLMWLLGRRRGGDDAERALVWDMGQFVHSSRGYSRPVNKMSHHQHSKSDSAMERTMLATWRAVDGYLGHMDATTARLHLYQIVSPVLVERAQHFGPHLALKDEWICVDGGCTSALGATCQAGGGGDTADRPSNAGQMERESTRGGPERAAASC